MQACKNAKRAAAATADGAAFPEPAPSGRSDRARKGKIARLPHSVRESLNERLRDGVPPVEITAWLNLLPIVRELLEKYFAGSPITEDNLSNWRHGGFTGWLENQQTREAISTLSAACRNIHPADRDAMTGQLSSVVAARMVPKLRKFDEMPEGPLKEAAWQKLVWSLSLLRRGEFYAGKLRLEQDKFSPKEEAKETPLCAEEMQERIRHTLRLGGPSWINFTKQWEGEGAAELVEKEEIERLVREEYCRHKAARAAQPPPNPSEPAVERLPSMNLANAVKTTDEHT